MDTEIFEPATIEPTLDVAPKKKMQRRRFSPEFKRQVVEEVVAGHESVSVIARRHDLNTNLVFKWKQHYRREQSADVAGPKLMPVHVVKPSSPGDSDRSELRGRIEIGLRAGRTVTVHGEVPAGTLRTVLEVLR